MMREHGLWQNRDKRTVGAIPGVLVGDLFLYRMELCVVGLHGMPQAGIDYLPANQSSNGEPIATSAIASRGYENDEDSGDVIIYTGQGGQDKNSRQVVHQQLEGGNLALERSMHYGVEKLSNLKHLDLHYNLGLTKTPNFGDMPILKTLNLWGCENLEEVHPSLGHCRMLTFLDLSGSVKLKKLPKFVTMESLVTLYLEGTSVEEFSEICGDMARLSSLSVGSPWIRSLPLSLTGLRYLRLRNCEVLESILDTIRNLESLFIENFNKLATLPNSLFESHEQLKVLHIYRCSGLVELPISLGVQKKLFWLRIIGYENSKKLPSSIQMESLQELYIYTGLRELPSSIGNLSSLIQLNLEGCEDLVSLPNTLSNLMNLRQLFLRRCKKLEKLPENIGELQELETLDATEAAISQPPPSITKLGKLLELRFSHVLQHVQHSSTFVFRQLSALSSLRLLDLSNLIILGGLPEDLGSLISLGELNVSGSNISWLPKSIKKLLHLWHLNVQFCRNLNELPGELTPNLEELFVDYHLVLKSIRDLVTKCLKLCALSISYCGHEKSEYGTVSTCQFNVLKFLQQLIETGIQRDFQQRGNFVIFFSQSQNSRVV